MEITEAPGMATLADADVAGAALNLNSLNQTVASLDGGGSTGGNVTLGSGNLTVWGGGGFAGQLSGSGQLVKTNFTTGGTLTLSNANMYSGGTIVGGFTNNTTLVVANTTGSGTGSGYVQVLTNGTFSIGAGGPGGSTAATVITNDGTVRVSRSDDIEFTNVSMNVSTSEKTGRVRKIPAPLSKKYVKFWMNDLPYEPLPDAVVFCSLTPVVDDNGVRTWLPLKDDGCRTFKSCCMMNGLPITFSLQGDGVSIGLYT